MGCGSGVQGLVDEPRKEEEEEVMNEQAPLTSLDARYSEEDAQATPWPDALGRLEKAGLFWVSTVRADGRPHVTPVVAVWLGGALYFTSGPGEQKSRNLASTGTAL